jgi:putative endonuclease
MTCCTSAGFSPFLHSFARCITRQRKRLRPHAARAIEKAGFYVYLLHSTSASGFYIGFSSDLKRRLVEHKQGASFATKSRAPWKLIYYEAYTEREDAKGREKYLKSGSGGRFLRAQLRYYLSRVFLRTPALKTLPHAAFGAQFQPRERQLLRGFAYAI